MGLTTAVCLAKVGHRVHCVDIMPEKVARIGAGNVPFHEPGLQRILQTVLDSGALRVLIPLANKAQFAGLPEEVVEKLDIVFYGDVDRAVLKTLEM